MARVVGNNAAYQLHPRVVDRHVERVLPQGGGSDQGLVGVFEYVSFQLEKSGDVVAYGEGQGDRDEPTFQPEPRERLDNREIPLQGD